jgi:hypothetical protein
MKKKFSVSNTGSEDWADLVTPTQAAKIRGVTRAAISSLVKRGRLNTIEIGGRPFLRRREVENFEAEKPGPKAA